VASDDHSCSVEGPVVDGDEQAVDGLTVRMSRGVRMVTVMLLARRPWLVAVVIRTSGRLDPLLLVAREGDDGRPAAGGG
jgi:hypothetical protein